MTKLTMEQAIIVSGFTGILCCPFHLLHGEIEKRMGRPVFTHEMGTGAVMDQAKEKFKADFLALCPEEGESK